jgi:thiol:disulfide interchange protein DsbC
VSGAVKVLVTATGLALAAGIAQAGEAPATPDTLRAAAQARMGVTFANLSIVDFRASPLPGLYQADIGGRIVYYSPEPELLLFGQIFDKNGVDLTSQALSETHKKRANRVDLEKALMIGPAGAPEIVEFSNPDCGYCRLLNNFVRGEAEQGRPLRRKIIFTAYTDEARKKAEHILCAKDPEKAFHEIYQGAAPKALLTCREGRELVLAHAEMSRSAGIQGTPTLWLDGRTVEGFRQGELTAFLQSKRGVK